jgi:hypothetical protein
MRYRRAIIVAVLLVLVSTAVVLAGDLDGDQEASPGPKDVRLVDVHENGDRLWPYTSRHTDFGTRTLAINVIIYDDPDIVRYRLERRSNVSWAELNETQETANFSIELSESRVGFDWSSAHGAMRYTYVQRDGEGRWLPQRYQLHAGTYLGTRSHVRVYAPGGDSDWSAIQAHSEYWDWFRLRHGVTDVWETGRHLEEDFADQPLVSNVERAYSTDSGPTSDGISVVYVAWAVLAVSVPAVRRHVADVADDVGLASPTRRRAVVLFGFAMGVPLFVRGAGIGLEQALPGVSPKFIAAPLYVVLVAGLPVGVYRLSERVPAERAVALAAMGFLVGVTLDAVALDVVSVLERYALHRLALAVGLGAIAGGTRDPGRSRQLLVTGLCLWSGAVLTAALDLV